MTTYEPGTVAVATVRGVKDVRVFRMHGFWGVSGGNRATASTSEITDIRPLVVLDVGDPGVLDRAWENTVAALKEGHTLPFALEGLRDDIKAQTKPPRIPEPGVWGVVEAKWDGSENRDLHLPIEGHFVRDRHAWVSTKDGFSVTWSELINPVLVREGLS